MIYSMTGFGRGSAESKHHKITVELKSLNSKQLDLSARIPQILREYEIDMRNAIASELGRGKVDLNITCESKGAETPVTVDTSTLAEYYRQLSDAAVSIGINPPSDWLSLLTRLPDVMRQSTHEADSSESDALKTALREALVALCEFRRREGEKLEVFFTQKVDAIETLLDRVEPFETERVTRIRTRLTEELRRLDGIEYDAGRLEQELIFYIEKLDVTEEKTRLRAHINYFRETMAAPMQGQGKKLGFIAQEMGREINTLGSKANNAEMQRIVVMMKDELEQIKEQVLNVL